MISIIGAFGSGVLFGEHVQEKRAFANTTSTGSSESTQSLDMAPFWKSVETLNEKFVPTTASSSVPTNKDKVYAAIEGLAKAYGDPYTVFFPPKEAKSFDDQVRGDFGGIGVEIGTKNNLVVVIAPLKDSPGAKAGLKAGDIILKIDKKGTDGMSTDDAVSLIRGEKGTVVTLTVKHNEDTKDVMITRDTINIPTIDTKFRDDGVFVISLYSFSANSAELFRNALREFILSGSDKLILDLRDNPGGYLDASIDMASWFLPQGKTVVIEDSGSKLKKETNVSRGYNVFTDKLKMVILINGGSASASEILAGALHEQGIAQLVGEKSYGKGSVQELVDITPDTSLKVTIARWLTPKGHSISQNGLEPDVKIEITKKDVADKYDAQMEKAASILLNPNFTPSPTIVKK